MAVQNVKNHNYLAAGLIVLITMLMLTGMAMAKIPEPDNIIHGALGEAATVVTLKINGQAVAVYTVGDDNDGSYVLRVPMESETPIGAGMAAAGDLAEIYIDDQAAPAKVDVEIGSRGTIQVIDLGSSAGDDPDFVDADEDGLPDEWEEANGLSAGHATGDNGPDGDPDGDGLTNYEEWVNGSDPNDPASPGIIIPRIAEVIPHDGAGIDDDTRIANDAGFAVRIEDPAGRDIANTCGVTLTVDDGKYPVGQRDLDDTDMVTLIDLGANEDSGATGFWVVYNRGADDDCENAYPFDKDVNIQVDVMDADEEWVIADSFVFHVETEADHQAAAESSPETVPAETEGTGYSAGIMVESGDLQGATLYYNEEEPITPTFGPTDELPDIDLAGVDAIGIPMNLQPPMVFADPVTIRIPCPGVEDVSLLSVFRYNGTAWQEACDADGNVMSGGNGWMVPDSRVNLNDAVPPLIELTIYHFTGVQAASVAKSSTSGGGGGGGSDSPFGCFIDSLLDKWLD